MRNVALIRNFLGLTCALILTACTKTPVDVSSLGMKLSAPQLKSTDPFDQDMDNQGYVEFSGVCSPLVSKISISLDNQTFYDIPAQTPYTPAGGTATTHNNDTDCADGKFSFYLTDAVISVWLGHAPAEDEISTIFIRGDGTLGQTDSLRLARNKDGNGGGNNGSPAAALKIEKVFPVDHIGVGKCGAFNISARTANNEIGSLSGPVAFSITEVPGGAVPIYTNANDCDSNATTTTSATISGNNVQVYVRAPTTGSSVTYALGTSATLTTNSAIVVLHDAVSSSIEKWVGLDNSSGRIYKNICYPVKAVAHSFDSFGSYWSDHSPVINVGLNTNDANLQFFPTSACGTSQSTYSITSYSATKDLWVKYVDTVTTSGTKRASASATAVASGFNIAGDITTFEVDLDDTRATPKIVSVNGPNNVGAGICQRYQIRLMNQNWAQLPNNTGHAITVTLASSLGSSFGKFYPTSTACSSLSGDAEDYSLASGEMTVDVYFRAVVSSNTSITISASATSFTSASQPVQVMMVPYMMNSSVIANPQTFKTIAGGLYNTCAIDQSDHLYCSGDNSYGQLLDGTYTMSYTLKLVDGPTNYKEIAIGNGFMCGLTLSGDVRCWGGNAYGQLGNSTTSNANYPVLTASGYSTISAGESHVCGVLTSNGKIKCWGKNQYGQIGDGTTTMATLPTFISSSSAFLSVKPGQNHTCGLLTDGTVSCWGLGNYGMLGNNASSGSFTTPQTVSGLGSVTSISSGRDYTCAISGTDTLYCWGNNNYGQYGNGNTVGQAYPLYVRNGIYQVSAGENHTCGLDSMGAMSCWGYNSKGVLGTGDVTDQNIPTSISSGMSFTAMSASVASRCGLRNNGQLYCWGTNDFGTIPNDIPQYAQHYWPEDMSCYEVQVSLRDVAGNSINAVNTITGQAITSDSISGNLYGNSSCTGHMGTAVQNLSISFASGANQTTFWVRRNWANAVTINYSGFSPLISYGTNF